VKDTITISWGIDDVKCRNSNLTNDQARFILTMLKENHDANVGINWDVIDATIERYLSDN